MSTTVYTISTTILSTYASKYQFHDFAYLSDSSNCPSMFFRSQYFYGILRTTFFARQFRRIQVRKKKSNQISEKVIDTIKCGLRQYGTGTCNLKKNRNRTGALTAKSILRISIGLFSTGTVPVPYGKFNRLNSFSWFRSVMTHLFF